MEFTRPLDTLIDKFDFVNFKFSNMGTDTSSKIKNSPAFEFLNSNASLYDFIQKSLELWHESVEIENPTYFNLTEEDLKLSIEGHNIAPLYQMQSTLEAQLYDTSLDFLLLIIQKFSLGNLLIFILKINCFV